MKHEEGHYRSEQRGRLASLPARCLIASDSPAEHRNLDGSSLLGVYIQISRSIISRFLRHSKSRPHDVTMYVYMYMLMILTHSFRWDYLIFFKKDPTWRVFINSEDHR